MFPSFVKQKEELNVAINRLVFDSIPANENWSYESSIELAQEIMKFSGEVDWQAISNHFGRSVSVFR